MHKYALAFEPIVSVIFLVMDIILWIVFAWVILSWVLFFLSQTSFRWRNRGVYGVLMQVNDIFSRMTLPVLRPFRRLTRRWDTAGIDWSPILLLIAIYLIKAIITTLFNLILLQ
ncbi:MAG TPA: YggT family protein [Thermoanaerobaculia bacterium]|nr:YggT family protein [Thermoanaerobaculia bacterium]